MKIHIKETDNWIRVYVDGAVYLEGHTLNFMAGLELLINIMNLQVDVSREYIEDWRNL